jgi:hypothetical protein
MALEVVGAGFGRTGTLSLKFALEKLGFERCYHMMELMSHPEHAAQWLAASRDETVDWDALFEGYRAAVDWPASAHWKTLAARHPDSKVVLSTREPGSWYESVRNTIHRFSAAGLDSDDPGERARAEWAHEIIWRKIFDGRLDDREHCIAIFRAHEEEVKATIPAERLLVFEARDGWGPLCEFLGCTRPEEDYPRVNTTAEFLSRWEQPLER